MLEVFDKDEKPNDEWLNLTGTPTLNDKINARNTVNQLSYIERNELELHDLREIINRLYSANTNDSLLMERYLRDDCDGFMYVISIKTKDESMIKLIRSLTDRFRDRHGSASYSGIYINRWVDFSCTYYIISFTSKYYDVLKEITGDHFEKSIIRRDRDCGSIMADMIDFGLINP